MHRGLLCIQGDTFTINEHRLRNIRSLSPSSSRIIPKVHYQFLFQQSSHDSKIIPSLSLELRQKILTYLFEDAAIQDLHLNNLQLRTAPFFDEYRREHSDFHILNETIHIANNYNLVINVQSAFYKLATT
jgi:hypothetical protein